MRRYLAGSLLFAALAGCVLQGTSTPIQAQTTPTASATPKASDASTVQLPPIGVVDLQALLKAHPNWEKLEEMDKQVQLLESEKMFLPMQEKNEAARKLRDTMKAEFEKAQGELEGEKAAIEGQLKGMASSMSAQLRAEMQAKQAEAQATLAKYRHEVAPDIHPAADIGQQSLREYMENLAIMRSQRLTGKRLELEKTMGAAIDSERARLDSAAAASEDAERARYQDELVNLNLKVRLAKDDAEQKAIREQMDAVNAKIEAVKNAKRAESEGAFNAFVSEQKAKMQGELSAYEATLNREVEAKIGGKRQELANTPPPSSGKEIPADVKSKIERMESEMRASLAAKEGELKRRMEAEQAEAIGRLKAKQQAVGARLQALQKKMMQDLEDRGKYMSKETKAKLADVEKKLTKAKEDREALVKSMKSEIEKAVGDVAVKKNVPMVIGAVVLNLDTTTNQDLTDLSLVAVKQLRSKP